MSLHSAGQFARQSLGNAKSSMNYQNQNLREEDIISSIDPSIEMEKNEKDYRGNNYRNDYRYYEEDNNAVRNSKGNNFYDENYKLSANPQKTSIGSASKNINLNYNYFTDISSSKVNNIENRETKDARNSDYEEEYPQIFSSKENVRKSIQTNEELEEYDQNVVQINSDEEEENIQSNEEDETNTKNKNFSNNNNNNNNNRSSKDFSEKFSYEPSFPTSNITKTLGSSNNNNNRGKSNPSNNVNYSEPQASKDKYYHNNNNNFESSNNKINSATKSEKSVNNQLQELVYQKGKEFKNEINNNNINNNHHQHVMNNNRLNNNDINDNSSEQEKINDDLSSNEESRKGKKGRFNQNPMERISEVEGEDDKYTTIFDKINEEAVKNDYRINEDNYKELIDKNITSENVKYLFHPTLFDTEESKHKFQPEINKNSKIILSEKERNKSTDTQRTKPQPIELELYNDALKRREKTKKIEYNNMMAILLNASKTKISNNSHRIAINKIEKLIDEAVAKHEKNKKLSFIDIGLILEDLRIFRQIFSNENQSSARQIPSSSSEHDLYSKKNYQSYKDIKIELKNVKEREKRKKGEVDFYEQIWLTLNPDNKDFIKSDIFAEILKILFSPVASSVTEISNILKQFLLAAFFLNSNPEAVKEFVSPITEKVIPEEEIWPLDKLVKEFLGLKENILAYQNTKNLSKNTKEELEKIKKEQICFKPKILKNVGHLVNMPENAGNSAGNNNQFKSRSNFFYQRLPTLIERDKLRRQVLEEMKKESEEQELKECTFKPKINNANNNNNNKTGDSRMDKPVYEKLYETHREKQKKLEKKTNETKNTLEQKELQGCTFKPQLISQKNVSFENSYNSEKPRGFYETVERLRSGIIENFRKKYLIEKIPTGENYERIKNADIRPFNITDLKKKKEEKSQKVTTENEANNEEEYFSIQITIPSGKERTLRVHRDDDPYEIAENFCKVYGMKDEIKDRLAKTILKFINMYLIKQERTQNELTTTNNNNQISQNNLNLEDF